MTNFRASDDEQRDRLCNMVRDSPWCIAALEAARSIGLSDWCIGAGAIRNLVWDHLHGYNDPTIPGDIDLAHFDPSDLSRERDGKLAARLDRIFPGPEWDVVNQAGVHRWYPERFGQKVAPFRNIDEALASWPEYATCIGVRLEPDDSMTVVAPHGLDDLFGMIVRHNPTRISKDGFRDRLAAKRFNEKWPLARLHPI